MRNKLCILVLLSFCLVGCFDGIRNVVDWHSKYVELEKKYTELEKKPAAIKYMDRFIPQTTVQVVKDTEWQMGLLKVIACIGIALSAGATFFLRTFNLQIIGASGIVAFGTLFVLALVTQITTPFLPYFALILLVIFSVMMIIWIALHVDWKPHEKKGIIDLAAGIRDTPEAKAIVADAQKVTYLQSLTKLWRK